mmetsp:Transcript_24217/g.35881  ORF Transcript_24217/g.35881 Transcript_24217/m.35881 type:complete len:250 (-) Transcript_24217:156-905(-)
MFTSVTRGPALNAYRRLTQSTANAHKTSFSENVTRTKRIFSTNTNKEAKESFAKRHPFLFQLGVSTCKTMGADIMAQTVAEGKSFNEIDWKRNGIFVVFGFAYLGGFQYWLMVNKFRQWFPSMDRFSKLSLADKVKDTAGILDAIKMVVFDITIHLPMIYFPTYYAVKEFVSGSSWNPADWVIDGVTRYSNNLKDDLSAMIKLWGPSDCIQFILPVHIRMPFRHLVSFFWTAYVSFTRGAYIEREDTKE